MGCENGTCPYSKEIKSLERKSIPWRLSEDFWSQGLSSSDVLLKKELELQKVTLRKFKSIPDKCRQCFKGVVFESGDFEY